MKRSDLEAYFSNSKNGLAKLGPKPQNTESFWTLNEKQCKSYGPPTLNANT